MADSVPTRHEYTENNFKSFERTDAIEGPVEPGSGCEVPAELRKKRYFIAKLCCSPPAHSKMRLFMGGGEESISARMQKPNGLIQLLSQLISQEVTSMCTTESHFLYNSQEIVSGQ
jgi:hypothetical protein